MPWRSRTGCFAVVGVTGNRNTWRRDALFSNLGFMIEKGYSGRNVRDLNHLRETLTAEWDNLSQDVIDAAVAQFRPRLRGCVANAGG